MHLLYLTVSAEAANVNAGLGFNGFDENGNAKWDLLQNAKVRSVEVYRLEFLLIQGLCQAVNDNLHDHHIYACMLDVTDMEGRQGSTFSGFHEQEGHRKRGNDVQEGSSQCDVIPLSTKIKPFIQ